jgi:hypothetical protein
MQKHDERWNVIAWVLILSGHFWLPIILRSCSDGPLRPTELEPPAEAPDRPQLPTSPDRGPGRTARN